MKTENTKKLSVTFGELDRMPGVVCSECSYLFPCSRIRGPRERGESDWELPTGDFGGGWGVLEILTSKKFSIRVVLDEDRRVEFRYCPQLFRRSRLREPSERPNFTEPVNKWFGISSGV